MKQEWQSRELQEVCQFENGDRGENYPSKSVQTTTGVPFINAGHLTESGIDFGSMNYIPRERFDLLGNGKIRRGDILFCLRGSLGKFASVGELNEGAIASSLVIIRPLEGLSDRFLSAYLQSNVCAEMIDQYRNGAAQPNLSAGSLKKFLIPVPPPPEQHRIVAILDEAFDRIATAKANAEKNLQNARALFESHLQKVFTERGEGGVERPLGECFRLKSGDGLTSKAMKAGAFPVFGGNGITGTHNEFNLSGDNVIIGRVGALCGNARHITENIWLTDNAFKVVDYCHQFDGAFLTYLLNYKNLRSYARQAAQPVISNSSLSDLVLHFPELTDQQRIAASFDALLEETQRLESLYQQKLTALDDLKKSLLHQAFSGKL